MEASRTKDTKEEVKHSGNLKVKEENSSGVVYKVEVSSKVSIKTEEDTPKSQGVPTSIKNIINQSAIFIKVKSEPDPTSDALELETELTSNSNRESEIKVESDCNKEHLQEKSSQNSQASLPKIKQNNPKRTKRSLKNKKINLQCSLCPESFPTVTLLITHARNEHATVKNPRSDDPINDDEDENPSQCPLCSKSFTSVGNLHRHFLSFHNKNKPFQCSVCLESRNEIKKFATECILKQHIKQVHDPARYKLQCDICSYKCLRRSKYKRHKLTHVKKQYKCDYCSKPYRKKEPMLRHIIAVHKEYTDRHETFKCDECDQLFSSKKELDRHVVQTHVEDTVQCKICFKKFWEEGELSKHLEISHREIRTWLVCDVCSKVFKNNQELVKHLEVEHKRFFKCRKCFKSFVSKEDYNRHSTKVVDDGGRNAEKIQFQCKVCFVFLNTECSFATHKNTHLNPCEIGRKIVSQLDPEDPQDCLMKCDFCPKTFVEKSLLLDHATKCHPNKKWKCKSCEKSFQVKFQLNKHELLHSSNKPFECQVCHKGFANKHHLEGHEEIHKVDKKYKCSQCEQSFAYSSNRRVHMASHHGGAKPFKCDFCKKAFVFQAFLVRHSVVHTHEKPFSCSKCSYTCKRGFELRRHLQGMHSENRSNKCRKLASHLKYFKNLVYICSLEKCDFETTGEKEVALHYAKHNLPKVVLPKLLYGPSSAVFLSQSTPVNKHAIQARYKCSQCCKVLSTPYSLRNHTKLIHNGDKTKTKKRIYTVPSSDEDEM